MDTNGVGLRVGLWAQLLGCGSAADPPWPLQCLTSTSEASSAEGANCGPHLLTAVQDGGRVPIVHEQEGGGVW